MELTSEQTKFIRKQSADIEKTKTIPQPLLELIYQKKLFKLFVSKSLGGRALELPDALRVFQEASCADGNFGWAVTIGSGAGMFSANFYETTAKAYFMPEKAVIAGSGFPAGKAEKTKSGGYIVNGEWKYCSGSDYATMFTANCMVEAGESPEVVSFILNPDQVHVIEDWDAFGLKGTNSQTIQVINQPVPEDRTFSIFEIQNDFAEPVHTFPFVPLSEASFAAIVFGIGKHYLDEVKNSALTNKENSQQGKYNRYQFIMDKLQTERARWEKAEEHFYHMVEKVWSGHLKGEEISDETWEAFSSACKQGATTVLACAQNLFRYMGMESVKEHSSLNRIWRDLHTAAQHTFLTPYNEHEASPTEV